MYFLLNVPFFLLVSDNETIIDVLEEKNLLC